MIGELKSGNYEEALALAADALRLRPRDCELLSLKAVALTGVGDAEAALKSFQQALNSCPAYLPALEGAAQIDYARRSPEAVPLLTRALTVQPGNLTAHAMLASALESQGKCADALVHFEASKPLFPSRPDLLQAYGSCLAKIGDVKAALDQYLLLLATNPDDNIRYDVALLQWKTHADADALHTLAPLITAGHNEAALALAARIYEHLGDTPKAVDLLRSAILLAPGHAENYLDFADIAFAHKSFQVGVDMLNAGLQRLPGEAALYVARGVLEVQLSQSNAAIADFEQAHHLDPALSFAVDAMGIMQNQQHQKGQSLALFESQAKLHPDDPLLQYLLAEQLSETATGPASADLEAAITAARRASTLDPRYKAAHDLLAVLYLRSKRPELAIKEAELALAQDPTDQDALYQEILATRRSGNPSKLPGLLARFDEVRKENERKQQDVDRYRLQDGVAR